MAIKGQIFRSYTYDEKIVIVKEYLDNRDSTYGLAKKYCIPRTTIKSWIEKYRKNGDVPKLTTGDKRKNNIITLKDYKERYEILKKYQAFLKAQREKK